MQRKTVKIYSFSNGRSKDSYAQNFYVLKSFNILELTYNRICSILKIILKIV